MWQAGYRILTRPFAWPTNNTTQLTNYLTTALASQASTFPQSPAVAFITKMEDMVHTYVLALWISRRSRGGRGDGESGCRHCPIRDVGTTRQPLFPFLPFSRERSTLAPPKANRERSEQEKRPVARTPISLVVPGSSSSSARFDACVPNEVSERKLMYKKLAPGSTFISPFPISVSLLMFIAFPCCDLATRDSLSSLFVSSLFVSSL